MRQNEFQTALTEREDLPRTVDAVKHLGIQETGKKAVLHTEQSFMLRPNMCRTECMMFLKVCRCMIYH
jgi:hypothetical protein